MEWNSWAQYLNKGDEKNDSSNLGHDFPSIEVGQGIFTALSIQCHLGPVVVVEVFTVVMDMMVNAGA